MPSQKWKCSHSLKAIPPLHLLSPASQSSGFTTDISLLLQGHISPSRLHQIHAHAYRLGKHQDNLIATRLIGQYPSHIAFRVFHQLQRPNIFPFNAIIRVLAEDGRPLHAFALFKSLKHQSLLPNDFTFSFLLKACLRSNDTQFAKQIHSDMVKMGFVGDSLVWNGLLLVFAKGLKDVNYARKVFDEMPNKELVSCWSSMIAGYAKSGRTEEVLQLFLLMGEQNIRPNDDAMINVFSACSNIKMDEAQKWVSVLSHLIANSNAISFHRDSTNTLLIYLYGKLGEIEKSRESFNDVVDKSSVLPWNSIIGAYVQNGCPMEALSLFNVMMKDFNYRPNHVTMVSVLSACAQTGDLKFGIWVHEYIKHEGRQGITASNRILATALIDMYSKCGNLERAKEVFDLILYKDVVSFNAMIMGLAVNSDGMEALDLFSKMQELGIRPSLGTFIGVLTACSHSGLTKNGGEIFIAMLTSYSMSPRLEHYACLIDLFARTGLLEEALEVVSTMPFEPNNFVWGALLGGCLLHSRADLAAHVSEKLVQVDPHNSAGFVMLANTFAANLRWRDVSEQRLFMKQKGVKKQPGRSWISIDGVVHEFTVLSPTHPSIDSIYITLNELTKQMKQPVYGLIRLEVLEF